EGWDGDLGPQCGRRDVDGELVENVLVRPFELRVILHFEYDVEVSGLAPPWPNLTFAAEPDLLSGVDAGRHLHGDRVVLLRPSRAAADHAGAVDHAPFAVTAGTGRNVHELPKDALLRATDFSRAITGGARLG